MRSPCPYTLPALPDPSPRQDRSRLSPPGRLMSGTGARSLATLGGSGEQEPPPGLAQHPRVGGCSFYFSVPIFGLFLH